jgi:type II secretion system protein J
METHMLKRKCSRAGKVHTADRGLTLIELLVASLLFAIIGVALYGTYRNGQEAYRRSRARAERLQLARSIFAFVRKDLQGCLATGGFFDSGFIGMDSEADGFPRDYMTLVTRSFAPREGAVAESDLGEVEYLVDSDTETEEVGLIRRIKRNLLAPVEEELEVQELAPEVIGLNFAYYDGETWQDSWDSTVSESLPLAVKVQIRLKSAALAAEGAGEEDADESEETGAEDAFFLVIPIPQAAQGEEEQGKGSAGGQGQGAQGPGGS